MGQDLKMEFDKYCVVDGSPKTVLLSPRISNIEKKKVRKKPKSKNEVFLSQNKEFTEISFKNYRSASCRPVPTIRLQADEAPRRGSVYQSSKELGKMNGIKENETEMRKKIAVSRRNPVPFSLEIVDSLCSSDEDSSSIGSFKSSFLGMSQSSTNKENLSRKIPLKTENEGSKTSPKTSFSPFRKMFDPFTKSKSQKRHLASAIEEPNELKPSTIRNSTLRKSLLNDFLNTESDKDSCSSIPSSSSSPAHLSGILKLRNKNLVPYFEFSVKNPYDVWVARKWNTDDGFNWVYTFHLAQNKRKSNASGRGSKDYRTKEFLMMAQMQVSCYLCTDLINAGAFDNIMVTEFVLYDGLNKKEESNEVNDREKVNIQNNLQTSNPRPVADLRADLESAAIVLQFPSGKREKLLNRSLVKLEETKTDSGYLTPAKVSVVIPSGNHGLPSDETHMVSPLLDRWRLGGGCDCGGWDMGCPLVVFGSPDTKKDKIQTSNRNRPLEIFLKGSKENTPALTMKLIEEGQYAVDFHAQLSSLQAFSVCVSILHGTESHIDIGADMNRQMLQCDSLRVFMEDEVKHLSEVVTEGEKRKPSKNLDEISPSFVVNPPFSPMSRA